MNDNGEYLHFTPESFAEFKAKYEALKESPDAAFTFEGKTVLVGYAKYVIEYIEEASRR